MARRRRRRRRRITPLGYVVLSIIILVMLVGIYFIIASFGKSAESKPEERGNATVVTPTPSLPPVQTEAAATPSMADAAGAVPDTATSAPEASPTPTVKPDDTPEPDIKTPSPSQVKAAVDGKLKERLNLRQGPGKEYTVIGTYDSGTRLKVYALENGFYFVMVLAENKYGYMSADYVEKSGLLPGEDATPVPDAPAGKIAGTVTSKVALRTVPTTEGNNPVGQLEKGTSVYILFKTEKFYYIEIVSSGQKYYAFAQYIRADGAVPEGTPVP